MRKVFLLSISLLLIIIMGIVAYFDENLSIVILVMEFIFLGMTFTIILNWKKNLQNPITIFLLFFLIYLLYTSFIHFGLISFYDVQNVKIDEIFFYTSSNDVYQKIQNGYNFLEISKIQNYRDTSGAVYFGGIVATLANSYGENSILIQKIAVVFIASLIPMVMYAISRLYLSEKIAIYTAVIYGLFSFVPYLSSILLRDIHIALMFIITIYIILQKISILNLLILFFVTIFSYYLREETGIFMMAFISIYFFTFIHVVVQNKYIKYIIYILLAYISIYIIMESFLIEMFDKVFSSSNERSTEAASMGSMGVLIAKLPFGLNIIALFGFSQIQPFPPLWIFQAPNKGWFELSYLIAGIAWFIGWGFLLYGFIVKKIFMKLDLKLTLMLILSLLYLLLIAVVDFGPRRQMAVYPILYLVMVFSYLNMTVTERTKMWIGMSLFYLTLILIINYIKI